MPIFPPAVLKELGAEECSHVLDATVYFSTPTHNEDGWLASRFRRKHTPVTPMRKAFVENRPALVAKNAYGEYVAQFDDPPQDHGWHVVEGPVDFVGETIEGEIACESSSAVVAITEIDEK